MYQYLKIFLFLAILYVCYYLRVFSKTRHLPELSFESVLFFIIIIIIIVIIILIFCFFQKILSFLTSILWPIICVTYSFCLYLLEHSSPLLYISDCGRKVLLLSGFRQVFLWETQDSNEALNTTGGKYAIYFIQYIQ